MCFGGSPAMPTPPPVPSRDSAENLKAVELARQKSMDQEGRQSTILTLDHNPASFAAIGGKQKLGSTI